MIRALIVIALLAVAGTGRGQDNPAQGNLAQAIYASIEGNIRREYDVVMDRVSRVESTDPSANLQKLRRMWSMIYYNRAVLFSNCAAEAEQYRSPAAPRVPAQNNLLLTTCVEDRLGGVTRFTNMFSYASIFFPDRIERCGEASRLREQEKLLPPYEFLQFAEPKLYDFPRYNACLMTADATAPAAR